MADQSRDSGLVYGCSGVRMFESSKGFFSYISIPKKWTFGVFFSI